MVHSLIITSHPLIKERRIPSYTLNKYPTVLTNNRIKCAEAFKHAHRKNQNGSHDSIVEVQVDFCLPAVKRV